jgi:CspA family cold shock protein
MKLKGKVKWFDSKKGYGFITREDGQGDVFVHWSEIKTEGFKTLVQGEEVEFSLKEDPKGVKAVEV